MLAAVNKAITFVLDDEPDIFQGKVWWQSKSELNNTKKENKVYTKQWKYEHNAVS